LKQPALTLTSESDLISLPFCTSYIVLLGLLATTEFLIPPAPIQIGLSTPWRNGPWSAFGVNDKYDFFREMTSKKVWPAVPIVTSRGWPLARLAGLEYFSSSPGTIPQCLL